MPEAFTILLVEDNEDDVFLMRRALKSAKIFNPVQVVEDGQKAIDYLAGEGQFTSRAEFPYPQVVFLDLKLPEKSGFEVLEWLRTRLDLPVPIIIVLSSSNSPYDIQRATALGAKHYAVKPPQKTLFLSVSELFDVAWETGVSG